MAPKHSKDQPRLTPERCTSDPEVVKNVAEARAYMAGREVSDIVDDAGMQYVDLVMEGGGVLGIALVGYTYLLEEVGIRFLGVGGTSAGAINAVLTAALDEPSKAKSGKVLAALCAKDLYDFVDGDQDARDFIDALVEGKGGVAKALKLLQVLDNLNHDLGLNPGDDFRRWVETVLAAHGIADLAGLEKRMGTLPRGLRFRGGEAITSQKVAGSRLAVVAADVTTETKVVFPDMADLYFADPGKVSPAAFARASMSIPLFFRPYQRRGLPRTPSLVARWREAAGIRFQRAAEIPDRVLFVDGGIVSNFPIALFHDTTREPPAPTFGVKLGYDLRRHKIAGPIQLLGAIFNTARHTLDYDFISKNPDYRQLVQIIPVNDFNWLDFRMADDRKLALFRAGVLAAAEFLRKFEWAEYKQIRVGLVAASCAAAKAGGT